MNKFTHISPEEITKDPFSMIGKEWMLVTSANSGDGTKCGTDYNTMTASWGGVGILWNKPVAFVFIRPQRHTFGFTEANDTLTLSFFDEEYRSALTFCGRQSGRDTEKAEACSLTPVFEASDGCRTAWFDEARMVLKAKKLYSDFLSPEGFAPELDFYPEHDYHKMYICEITDVLMRA